MQLDASNTGWIPGCRSPGGGNGNPLQYSCLENPIDRGAWQLQCIGSQRVGHDWSSFVHTYTGTRTLLFKRVLFNQVTLMLFLLNNIKNVYVCMLRKIRNVTWLFLFSSFCLSAFLTLNIYYLNTKKYFKEYLLLGIVNRGFTQEVSFVPFTNFKSRRKCCLVTKLCPTLCDPHGLWPTRLLCPWDRPGQNNGVGCHFLLQGIFPTHG